MPIGMHMARVIMSGHLCSDRGEPVRPNERHPGPHREEALLFTFSRVDISIFSDKRADVSQKKPISICFADIFGGSMLMRGIALGHNLEEKQQPTP